MSYQNRKKLTVKEAVLTIVIMMVMSSVLMYFFAWWTCLLATAGVSILRKYSALAGFTLGFIGVALVWLALAAFHSLPNQGMLADQMGQLIGGLSATALLLVTSLLGGICGGLGGWSGTLLRKALR